MKKVGVYEAKTQLPRLLDEVEQGQVVEITRHGRPVARLVPIGTQRLTVDEAIKATHEFRSKHRLDGITVRELIDEGRK